MSSQNVIHHTLTSEHPCVMFLYPGVPSGKIKNNMIYVYIYIYILAKITNKYASFFQVYSIFHQFLFILYWLFYLKGYSYLFIHKRSMVAADGIQWYLLLVSSNSKSCMIIIFRNRSYPAILATDLIIRLLKRVARMAEYFYD